MHFPEPCLSIFYSCSEPGEYTYQFSQVTETKRPYFYVLDEIIVTQYYIKIASEMSGFYKCVTIYIPADCRNFSIYRRELQQQFKQGTELLRIAT